MVVFPNCKINLGLRICSKRADGFHDLETVFFPVPLKDALELIPAPHSQEPKVIFTATGLSVTGSAADNLCVKAYELLRKDFPGLPAVKMHLHKAIPMGAGLGGGSADAAFALQLLNDKFNLGLTEDQLISYSLQLGSDCPFFILNKPAYATGRGEILTPLELNLSNYQIVLVNPGIHVNTGWAFGQLNRGADEAKTTWERSLQEVVAQPLHTWKYGLANDFEKPVFELHPQLKHLKELMYEQGAIFAAMSGSGSTVFGIFDKSIVPAFNWPDGYFTMTFHLGT